MLKFNLDYEASIYNAPPYDSWNKLAIRFENVTDCMITIPVS